MQPRLFASLSGLVAAHAALAGPLQITWYTIDGGGGTITGGTLTLSSTIGQHDAGVLTGGTFTLQAGFWPGPEPDSCYPDCNNSGTLTIADFGCFQAAFASANMDADCNNSGTLTIADFGCFQAAFAAGCP